MNDLLKRSLSGAVYVLVLMAGTLLHPLLFAAVFTTLLVLSQMEFYRLFKNSEYAPFKWCIPVGSAILFLVCFGVAYGLFPKVYGLLAVPFFVVILLLETFRKENNSLQNSAMSIFSFVYIGLPFCVLNFIVFPDFANSTAFNPWILAGVFFIVWVNDSMAYVGGSLFGKHKLAEKISPNKSMEGAITGAVFAVIMGIINAVLFQNLGIISWIVISLIVVVFGTLGDLFESKIKRALNVKDTGSILPGHGGFLDRLDSLLFALPIIFFWLLIETTLF